MEEKYLKQETLPIFNKMQKDIAPESKVTLKADSFVKSQIS